MNKVVLIGRFTKDPEQRMTQSNLEIARFSLACQADFVNKSGEREVEFVNCVVFGRTATTINKYCKKGSLISVVGRIKNGSYEAKDGTKRYTTEVVIEQMEMLSSKPVGASSNNNNYDNNVNDNNNYSNNFNNVETNNIGEDPYKNFGEQFSYTNDDLPF